MAYRNSTYKDLREACEAYKRSQPKVWAESPIDELENAHKVSFETRVRKLVESHYMLRPATKDIVVREATDYALETGLTVNDRLVSVAVKNVFRHVVIEGNRIKGRLARELGLRRLDDRLSQDEVEAISDCLDAMNLVVIRRLCRVKNCRLHRAA